MELSVVVKMRSYFCLPDAGPKTYMVGEEEGEGDLVIGSAFKCDVLVVTCYGTFVTLVIWFLLDL
jgi:hypothetical protein